MKKQSLKWQILMNARCRYCFPTDFDSAMRIVRLAWQFLSAPSPIVHALQATWLEWRWSIGETNDWTPLQHVISDGVKVTRSGVSHSSLTERAIETLAGSKKMLLMKMMNGIHDQQK
jgi:hypothetical protein